MNVGGGRYVSKAVFVCFFKVAIGPVVYLFPVLEVGIRASTGL